MLNGLPPEVVKKYEDDIKKFEKQEENVEDLQKQLKEELISNVRNIIGVFGSYTYTYPDGRNGEEVIDYIANKASRKNPSFLVVTGKSWYIYKESTDEFIKESTLQNCLQEFIDKGYINDFGYCRILASICNFAVFIINPETRSTSEYEEHEFFRNFFERNILGIGVLILKPETTEESILCGCFDIEKNSISGNDYYHCMKIIKGEIPNCPGSFHKTTFASLKQYVEREFLRMVATRNWELIPDIFDAFKSKIQYNN